MKNPWHHAPVHLLGSAGVYMVTSAAYHKEHLFHGEERLKALQAGLLKYAEQYEWNLQAWAVFPNHYHFIGSSPKGSAENLTRFLRKFHSRSALWVNRLDQSKGRQVWHNFWDNHLTFENSYYARLNYVHQNAVKHGLVTVADQYPWCSARWFQRHATRAEVQKIYRFPTNRLNIEDDYGDFGARERGTSSRFPGQTYSHLKGSASSASCPEKPPHKSLPTKKTKLSLLASHPQSTCSKSGSSCLAPALQRISAVAVGDDLQSVERPFSGRIRISENIG